MGVNVGVNLLGQAGDWVKGTPEYIAPARIYMLVVMLGGYISAAALYLAAIPAVKHDIAKREAVVRAGGSPQVCTPCSIVVSLYCQGHVPSDLLARRLHSGVELLHSVHFMKPCYCHAAALSTGVHPRKSSGCTRTERPSLCFNHTKAAYPGVELHHLCNYPEPCSLRMKLDAHKTN